MSNYRLSVSIASLLGVAFVFGLSGCSASFGDVSNTSTQTAMHVRGMVRGGQQPIDGAHVYLYAASTGAYGGNGIAPSPANASTSLLTVATGNTDGNGQHYVTTDAGGNFEINGAFACTPNTQVYLYSTGGNPQLSGTGASGTPNPAATLLAVVGDCASATPGAAFPNVTSVAMNEISTVAASYALAGFATDPLHIGAPSGVSGHSLSGIGLANAFNMALNIVNQASGVPNETLPLNNKAVVPYTTINTLADILAACVNSNGVSSSGCSTLFANTTYGSTPADTATAAISIAQHPGANVSNLLTLATNASPFQSFLSSANDLSLSIGYYTNSGLNFSEGIAIDSLGNAWVANYSSSVTKISSAGAFLSGSRGYNSGGLSNPGSITIDGSNNAWVGNIGGNVVKLSSTGAPLSGANGYVAEGGGVAIDGSGNAWTTGSGISLIELSNTGAVLSGTNGYTGGGLSMPVGIAIDGSGNIWLPNQGNSVTEFSGAGTALSGTNGYIGGGLNFPDGIAIDASGSAWVTNYEGSSLTKLSNTGAALSGSSGYTGGSLAFPTAIAIDGSGNAWVTNYGGGTVTELSSTGAVLSGINGYMGSGLSAPTGIAIDGSGNAWVSNYADFAVEIIGIGTPVITPIAAGLPILPTKDGSSNLGTRP
jgi:hypothetical protein